MPVLHVQPVPARLRQLRVVVQELEQDDDQAVTPRPAKIVRLGKRPTDKRKKKRGNFLLQEYFLRGNYFVSQFYTNSEKSTPGEITDITVLNLFEKQSNCYASNL